MPDPIEQRIAYARNYLDNARAFLRQGEMHDCYVALGMASEEAEAGAVLAGEDEEPRVNRLLLVRELICIGCHHTWTVKEPFEPVDSDTLGWAACPKCKTRKGHHCAEARPEIAHA